MSPPTLFDDVGGQPAALTERGAPLSADQRRTQRQRRDVELGKHPLTGEQTRPDLGTCGTCALRSNEFSPHGYPKCTRGAQHEHRAPRPGPYMTRGAATDCRAWWPACPSHQPASGLPTPGAQP